MRVTVDTNVLLRAAVRDDEVQARAADKVLNDAAIVVVTLPCLCEFVWVLASNYKFSRAEIARAVELLCGSPNVLANRAELDAGLTMLKDGGDFADGAIAYAGRWMGGETFVSFDKKAVALTVKQGLAATLLE